MIRTAVKRIWQTIDGPIGAILVLGFAFNTGYIVRGYEDGGLIATLMERTDHARLDERAACGAKVEVVASQYHETAKLRDQQIATLTNQYHDLAELVRKGAWAQAESARKSQAAIDAARQAALNAKEAAKSADEAADKADEASQKATAVDKKLDRATQPAAVVPHKAWGK